MIDKWPKHLLGSPITEKWLRFNGSKQKHYDSFSHLKKQIEFAQSPNGELYYKKRLKRI